jgi:hypothetical protein
MPIVPVFPSSSGAAPAAAQLRSIGDLAAGYTFSDTAALLSSYSYNAGTDVHTFTLATVAVGAETNSFLSGPNFTGPKWHQPMTYADGQPVLAGDVFSIAVYLTDLTPGLVRQYTVAVATVQTPASTVIGTMRPSGVYAVSTSTGAPGMGGFEDNLGSAVTTALMTKAASTTVFLGSPTKYRGGSSFAVTSAAAGNVGNRIGGGSFSVADSAQLNLAVMIGTNGTVTATGGAISMRLRYALTKLS